jgi:small subunit ribosomal protein S2
MRSYIYNKNSKIHILDLQKIIISCEKVGKYLKSIIEKRETILFLSTKKQSSDIVKEQAIRCGMPYIINK